MNQPTDRDRQRTQLLEAMSAVSEDRTCSGWASDWARTLHAEGGIWETLGRAVGWPTGNYDQWVWVSWDEAARLYGHDPAVSSAGQAPATNHTDLRDRIRRAVCEAEGFMWNTELLEPDEYGEVADAVLAVLPAPTGCLTPDYTDGPCHCPSCDPAAHRTDRAATLREADWIVEHCPDHGCVEPATEVCHCEIADRLRRLADEQPTAPTDRAAVIRAIADALVRMDAMVWLGCRRGDRDHDEPIGQEALAERLADAVLRRLADETPDTQTTPEACAHCGNPICRVTSNLAAWWVHDPGGNTVCDWARPATSTRATPPAAGARQDGDHT